MHTLLGPCIIYDTPSRLLQNCFLAERVDLFSIMSVPVKPWRSLRLQFPSTGMGQFTWAPSTQAHMGHHRPMGRPKVDQKASEGSAQACHNNPIRSPGCWTKIVKLGFATRSFSSLVSTTENNLLLAGMHQRCVRKPAHPNWVISKPTLIENLRIQMMN